ncbi:MAG: FAD-binding oxidoreductase [Thermomicrobiales bacterium]
MLEFDGVSPDRIVQVASAGEVADVLGAEAAASGSVPRTVVPIGGGTAMGVGNVVDRVDLAIDLSGMRGVENYNPSDLTLTARAGTTLEELQGELALHGQELPIEAPLADRATVGGLIATAFAGPRRYGFGTLKDALIGASFVRGDGLAAKAGGLVVKNVSGFEISRFLHGSWGTLAVITSANFKVTPIPKADRTLSIPFGTAKEAIAAFRQLIDAGVRPAAAEIEVSADESMLHVRLLGALAGVQSQDAMAERALVRLPQLRRDGDEGKAFWRTLGETWASTPADIVQVVVGVRPRDVGETTVLLTAQGTGIGAETLLVSPGTGTIRARFAANRLTPTDLWARLSPLRVKTAGAAIVEFAPTAWRRQVDVWGPPPSSISMMRTLKREFDPTGVLNRGRMMV